MIKLGLSEQQALRFRQCDEKMKIDFYPMKSYTFARNVIHITNIQEVNLIVQK